jgi:hypothetical protein
MLNLDLGMADQWTTKKTLPKCRLSAATVIPLSGIDLTGIVALRSNVNLNIRPNFQPAIKSLQLCRYREVEDRRISVHLVKILGTPRGLMTGT